MSIPAAVATRTIAIVLTSDHALTDPCDALYIGTGGTVILIDRGGITATFTNVPDGAILPVGAGTVKSTANGTTASDIVALYF